MNNIVRKLAILVVPFMMVGCVPEAKNANNFFSTNIVKVGYDKAALITLTDPQMGYKWTVEFNKDTILKNIVLSGGLKGKSIDLVAMSEDLHSLYVTVSGESANKSAATGTISIKPAGMKILNPEYSGYTFNQTFDMGENTEYKSAF